LFRKRVAKPSVSCKPLGSARFLKIYEEYKKAPEVTRKRMYLETMERVLGGTDKIILDSKDGQSVLPYITLEQLRKP
jgi:membrane protease subunit HflK